MVTVILSHEVSNFATWKIAFDEGESLRQKAGVQIVGVYNDINNANLVTVITTFPSTEAVNGFLASPDLKADMEKAGVVGAPEIKILNQS